MTNTETAAPVLALDPEKLGSVLIRLGSVSHALGHENIQGTLRPYCNHPESTSPEVQFVYDLVMRSTQEVIDRWYGGEDVALDFSPGYLLATYLASDDPA